MNHKTRIFNLALQELFLQKRISDADTDTSTEAHTLRVQWDFMYPIALSELNLTSTSRKIPLELVAELPNSNWRYAYRYPNNAALVRRIVTCNVRDDKYDEVDMSRELFDYNGDVISVIMTNEPDAIAEIVRTDVPADTLTPEASKYIASRLAQESIPLAVGQNSDSVQKSVEKNLVKNLINAQRRDQLETKVYEPEWQQSGFVRARMS